MGISTTDPELLLMNQIERKLRKADAATRNRVAHWIATRDWSDPEPVEPRQIVLPSVK